MLVCIKNAPELWNPVPVVTSTKHCQTSALGNIAEERWEDFKSQKVKDFAMIVCLLVTLEVISIKPHQHGMSQTRMTLVNMTTAWAKAHKTSTIHKELGKVRSWRGILSQGRANQLVVWCQMVSPGNTHTNKTI